MVQVPTKGKEPSGSVVPDVFFDDGASSVMAGNMVTCAVAVFSANRFIFRVAPDKWAVFAGLVLPFLAGKDFNVFVASLPARLYSTLTWGSYDVSQRYSTNPRR